MINRNLLILFLFWNLRDEEVKCLVFNLTSFGTGKYDFVMNTKEIFNVVINSLVTMKFFITDQIIKHYQNTFFSWIVIFNTFVNILYIFCRHHLIIQ